ncbi:hypothetical protein BH20ACI4_BH20ACI4_13030 [soil metagenome]
MLRKNYYCYENVIYVKILREVEMNETEEMQMLHLRSVQGEILTAEESSELQIWYENSDRQESSILNNSQPIQNVEGLRRDLSEITEQTTQVSREVKNLISQNDQIRRENQELKKSLEARLLEKVA